MDKKINWVKDMEKENAYGMTKLCIKENGKMDIGMGKDKLQRILNLFSKENSIWI